YLYKERYHGASRYTGETASHRTQAHQPLARPFPHKMPEMRQYHSHSARDSPDDDNEYLLMPCDFSFFSIHNVHRRGRVTASAHHPSAANYLPETLVQSAYSWETYRLFRTFP